jgi:hypothetical protein
MLGAIVETKELLDTVIAAAIAGVGVTAAFAVLVFGVARSTEMARDDRVVSATLAGALALVAFAVVAAAIVLGIVVMTQK